MNKRKICFLYYSVSLPNVHDNIICCDLTPASN